MIRTADFDTWCWQQKARKASNSEMFSMSRSLSGRKEISKKELEQAVQDAASSQPGGNQAQNKALKDGLRRFDEQAEKELMNIFNEQKVSHKGIKKDGTGSSGTTPEHHDTPQAGKGSPDNALLRYIAASIIDELQRKYPENNNLQKLRKKTRYINNINKLLKEIEAIAHELDEDKKHGFEQPDNAQGEGRASGLSLQQGDKDLLPADGFDRQLMRTDEKESFAGITTGDAAEDLQPDGSSPRLKDYPASLLFDQAMKFARKRRAFEERIKQLRSKEISTADIQSMIDQLMEIGILSPNFSDTFIVNQERIAIQLAKEAFLALSKMFLHKPLAQTGTHDYGRRGITARQLDRVERSRSITSMISPMHTLRQGLYRRALYQSSPLLDEEDLMVYESRTKVGYSIVIAIDISGAVQFGKRIQGVRKACMAFGYFLKKYHPRDRVTYVAYHEKPKEVSLADVSRLKAINGTGKDIGGCLKQCMVILKRDPERVPSIVLIGDGLPVRGDQAGFYRFKNNNQEVIEDAYYNARMLRKNRVLFTFLQFREDRHLWRDYADEAAQRIASEAKGVLYRIDDPLTIAPSLIQSYRRLHSAQ